MTTAAFQSALARLVIDRAFRQSVLERGARALPARVSPLEAERLCAVARDRGLDITRRMYVSFRLARLTNGAPHTMRLLSLAGRQKELELYLASSAPRSFYYIDEALALLEHLTTRLARRSLTLPYLRDILDYERATLLLQDARARARDVRLVLRPRYDLGALLDALQRGQLPQRIGRSTTAIELSLIDGAPVVRAATAHDREEGLKVSATRAAHRRPEPSR